MPVNKDALKRYRIIDVMLSDPHKDYTTEEIFRAVNRECSTVTLRMIQKDIKAIEEDFEKKLIRNAGGRGTVKYENQAEPLFFKELTFDEEEILREVLRSLGQFDGLDNFAWLELLKKKLEMSSDKPELPIISFSKNEGLQMPKSLLGRLFTAISRKKAIRFKYTKFGCEAKEYSVYPYQLKQFNDRWFLLCTPLGDEQFPFNPEFIANFALDRMSEKFDYLEDVPYIETPVDINARFDEIIGVTLYQECDIEDIYFDVKPAMIPYVQTKWLHATQIELDKESESEFKAKYPSLADCKFFSIECRPNNELYSRFASFSDQVVLLEPEYMRNEISEKIRKSADNYAKL